MSRRYLAAAIILCIAVAAVWESRRWFSSHATLSAVPIVELSGASPAVKPPVIASEAPPVIQEIPPVAVLKKAFPKKSKKISPPKELPAPAHVKPVSSAALPAARTPLPVPPSPKEWKGNSDSSIRHEGQIVILNDQQWIRFWAEHHPHEVSPDVDFSRNMVVGVFLGQRPADAFSVDIMGVRALADVMVVDYIERLPPPGTFQIAVEVFPYDIKVVPRTTLHVKFNKLTPQYQHAAR
jgi:hypothetical protein